MSYEMRTAPIGANEIKKTVSAIRGFDYGESEENLRAVEKMLRDTYGDRSARSTIESELAEVLLSGISLACKQFICRQLWMIGSDASVLALGKLLGEADHHVVEAACYAIGRRQSATVERVLRDALGRASGKGLVAVIVLIAQRRDAGLAGRLTRLTNDSDPQVSEAAVKALGAIATDEVVATLAKLHMSDSPAVRTAASHALLQAGQQIARRGRAADADAVFRQLTGPEEPPQIRRGVSLRLK